MRTEVLKNLGLTEEQINGVMKENGIDIEREKNSKSIVETELSNTKKLLEEATKKIDSFSTMDVEAIKKESEDLKTQLQELTKKNEENTAALNKSHAIDLALINAKARNIKSVKANLDLDNIKLDGERLIGFEDQIEALKKSDSYLFNDIEEKIDEGNDGNSSGKKETVPPNPDKETKEDQMLRQMGLK